MEGIAAERFAASRAWHERASRVLAGGVSSQFRAAGVPDGHTILMGTIGTVAVAPALYASLPYDPDRAFAPIILASTSQFVVVAKNALPVENLPELIEHARKNSGRLNYGSAGNGSTLHSAWSC
ncbi:MAG TPA: tripartite tricarboxylate transporter substrate-binding protein [Falsiroseomonas sp.]|jgi:tripartite-type tricarboxylate transporter receptor subunit TctC|nr:tripartite tricarboxylate transporter substrate-binding protein [Falsiroseomonas sp.]